MKAITTKYYGPTNTHGPRMKAWDMDGNSILHHFDCLSSLEENHNDIARGLCQKMAWSGTLVSGDIEGGKVYVFISPGSVVEL